MHAVFAKILKLKTMKKIILCLVVALSLTATRSVFAQNQNGGQMQQMMKQYLKDSLQLSDALTDSVMAIRMEYQPKMREIFRDQSASADDKQSKIKDLRMQMEARYKSAGLTDDQVKKLAERDQRMREQMRNNRNNGGSK
jgi:hypothetical protein